MHCYCMCPKPCDFKGMHTMHQDKSYDFSSCLEQCSRQTLEIFGFPAVILARYFLCCTIPPALRLQQTSSVLTRGQAFAIEYPNSSRRYDNRPFSLPYAQSSAYGGRQDSGDSSEITDSYGQPGKHPKGNSWEKTGQGCCPIFNYRIGICHGMSEIWDTAPKIIKIFPCLTCDRNVYGTEARDTSTFS